jgi:hypothetical protein
MDPNRRVDHVKCDIKSWERNHKEPCQINATAIHHWLD